MVWCGMVWYGSRHFFLLTAGISSSSSSPPLHHSTSLYLSFFPPGTLPYLGGRLALVSLSVCHKIKNVSIEIRACVREVVNSLGRSLRCEDHVVLQLQLGLVVLVGLEVDHQVGLDGEDGVGGQPGVVLGVELRRAAGVVGVGDLEGGEEDQSLAPCVFFLPSFFPLLVERGRGDSDSGRNRTVAYHDVDVRGAHGVAVHHLQQLPAGAVLGQAVGGGVQAVEPVLAVLVGPELAPQVVGRLVLRVLEVVLAVGAGLPDVEHRPRDGLARQEVRDGAVHLAHAARLGRRVDDDAAAQVAEGRVRRPEGAEDGGGGGVDVGLGDDLVGDLIDEAVKRRVG